MRNEILRINSLIAVKDCATEPWFKLMATPHGFILLAGNIFQGSCSSCKSSGKPLFQVLALFELETPL